ncbi:Spherulin4 domain containing protein [Pyrenophora teres f. teres]|uniref:Spherulin4 domain containing protein n=1 Tax=Pyrenophora teres f. teres TaxID=97479 RepID=A0A6S6W2V0_9PLEO|nr:Spherulin4 domain containing protein [Pyrenophora teres f. teres]
MSLQTPRINVISSQSPQWRASSSERNISNPYNLAIPPQYHRRLTANSLTRETTKVPTINSSYVSAVPTAPEKAVLVAERPLGIYTSNSKSRSTIFSYHQATPYEPLPRKKRCAPSVDDRILAVSVTLTLALFLAIVIPLAAILPQKMIAPLPVSVLIPMYFKPEMGSWNRLHEAAIRYPETTFTVIINPNNGPGSTVWPTAEYIDAIESLHKYENIRTLGYIDTDGGKRDNATIRQEIAIYAGWHNVSTGLTLSGIYFDRTPHKDQGHAKAYLQNISATVRHSEGFGAQAFVAQNPGRVPDEGLMVYKPNVTVVFEGAYADMPGQMALHEMLRALKDGRENMAMLLHSVPNVLGRTGLRKIVDDVRRDVEWFTPFGWKGHEVHPSITPIHTFINHVAKFQVCDPSSIVYLPEPRCMGASVHSVTNSRIPLLPSLIDICSIAKHPDLQFLVIFNPNSGPGAAPWWPNADYIREIPRLNALPNVKTLGYICATYCKRSLDAALDDIEIYGARGRNDVHQGIDGVFVDETVNLYSHEAKNWLDAVDRKVAHSLGHIKSPIVIHNPGTAVNAALSNPGPDITVVVETSFKHFMTREYQEWLATSPYGRLRAAYMVHSVPEGEVKRLTLSLRERAGYLFITSASAGFYESFGSSWTGFVDTMAEG